MLIRIKKKVATEAELKTEQNKITKLHAFDSSYFRGKSHFVNDDKWHSKLFSISQIFYKD